MSFLVHIADRALNRPLLITPEKAAVILGVLGGRIGISAADLPIEASRFTGTSSETDQSGRAVASLPYRRTDAGVAVITITGSLVNRGAWVGANSGLTSYEGIKHQLATAVADPKVRSIILDIASPGGEAIGAFETAAAVREASAQKPVVAVVNGMAASAAYAIASGATEIVTTETGVSGSIGVVVLHADYSKALADEGIKATLIFAGEHKVDGNPFEALPADVRTSLQAEVDAFYEAFLKTVSAGRGARTTTEAARATGARTFIGAAAVAAGLADRIGTFESVLADLSRGANSNGAPKGRSNSPHPGGTMSENKGAPVAENTGFTQAQLDAAHADGMAKGRADGISEAHARIGTVAGTEGIKGNGARLAAALDLCVKAPAMSATDVAAFVTGSIPDAPATGQRRENPANALGDEPKPAASGFDRGAEIGAKFRTMTGRVVPATKGA